MQEPPDEHQLRRVLLSLGTSILVTFAAAFALNDFLGYGGTINEKITNAITVSVGILFAAFLYSLFSVGMLQNSARRTIAKVARNFFVAVAVTLLFNIYGNISSIIWAIQMNCVNCITWWYFYSSLVSDSLQLIFPVFVAISVFSFDYTRRGSSPSEPTIVAEPAS